MTVTKSPDSAAPAPLPANFADSWNEAVDCTAYLVRRHREDLDRAARAAATILTQMDFLFPILDTLCRHTCPACEDPCCRKAWVTFDHADLLFLLLTGQHIPRSQPRLRPRPGVACTCLTPGGCRLPRHGRPWICTWYLCPAQKVRLNRMAAMSFARHIDAIKQARNEMEAAFIAVAARATSKTGL